MERMQGEGELDHLEQSSPLSDKERLMIQDSWAKVYQTGDDAGVAILIRYFSVKEVFFLRRGVRFLVVHRV